MRCEPGGEAKVKPGHSYRATLLPSMLHPKLEGEAYVHDTPKREPKSLCMSGYMVTFLSSDTRWRIGIYAAEWVDLHEDITTPADMETLAKRHGVSIEEERN